MPYAPCPVMDKKYEFKFKSSTALLALKAGNYDPINFYQARLDLFNLSIMADYDQLVCLTTLTAIDKYWYQIETARKVRETTWWTSITGR